MQRLLRCTVVYVQMPTEGHVVVEMTMFLLITFINFVARRTRKAAFQK